jgi:DNA invertase Pin-like site-specific DNA recombinase
MPPACACIRIGGTTFNSCSKQGKILGRPKGILGRSKLDDREEEIRLLLKKGVSNTAIAKITEVDKSTLYHFIKTRKLV